MSLLFRDAFKFLKHLVQVPRSWVGYFVLEVEVDALCGRHGDGVLALVLLDKLPKGVGTELFLETQGHDFIFLDLCPLDAIYVEGQLLSERSNWMFVSTVMS